METLFTGLITAANGNEWLLFLVIMFFIMKYVLKPMYQKLIESRNEKESHNAEREKGVLSVVSANTEAMTKLSVTLDKSLNWINNRLEDIHAGMMDLKQMPKV
jgi:hypothetical protein